jgi:hypothetical protein
VQFVGTAPRSPSRAPDRRDDIENGLQH